MKTLNLILFLICMTFGGQSLAMRPDGGGAKKIDIPKGQPGYSALEEARSKGGQRMSREKAMEYKEKFKKMYPHEYTKADIEILKEVHRVLGTGDKLDEKGPHCCNNNKCKDGSGVCYNYTDPATGKLKCQMGSTPCY
jgi:hypothetical protein